MKISIEYFAILKEQRGRASETIETNATTPGALYTELRNQHSFSLERASLKVAVNEDFSDWDSTLKDNDTVVFIPPVAGG